VAIAGDRSVEFKQVVDTALADGDLAAAELALERLWRRHPGPANATFVLSRRAQLPPARTGARVALLRSCTVEPLVPILRAGAAVRGLDLDVEVGGYNTFAQELLDPASPVYTSWAPDVVIVIAPTRDVAPELWDGSVALEPERGREVADRVVSQFVGLASRFRNASAATLLVHGLDLPPVPALGIADSGLAGGQADTVRSVNERLATALGEIPGVHLMDYDGVVASTGRSSWYDERRMASVRMPFSTQSMVPLVDLWLRYLHPISGRVAKALVCDLDNTLWGGVVGEDGLDGLRLGADAAGIGYARLQRAILDVQRRGVLLGIASKNNPADVDEVFDRHPGMVLRREHFSASRVSWDDKASSLRSIATELNIGLDSIAFIDDNPSECALIRQALPEVIVIELDEPPAPGGNVIEGNPLFERLALSEEDRRRTDLYRQQHERAESAASVTSLDEYLESLGTWVEVAPMAPADLVRTAQLTQKTNQFNVTTRRYSEQEVLELADGDDGRVYVVRAGDRFGDHGTVGVAIVRVDAQRWNIDTLLLSCRVIGRGVETAMLATLCDEARRAGASEIVGTFIPTAKNAPASEVFAVNGFVRTADRDEGSDWVLDLDGSTVESPPWITLNTQGEPSDRTARGA
jgi:FkbH-like protein